MSGWIDIESESPQGREILKVHQPLFDKAGLELSPLEHHVNSMEIDGLGVLDIPATFGGAPRLIARLRCSRKRHVVGYVARTVSAVSGDAILYVKNAETYDEAREMGARDFPHADMSSIDVRGWVQPRPVTRYTYAVDRESEPAWCPRCGHHRVDIGEIARAAQAGLRDIRLARL